MSSSEAKLLPLISHNRTKSLVTALIVVLVLLAVVIVTLAYVLTLPPPYVTVQGKASTGNAQETPNIIFFQDNITSVHYYTVVLSDESYSIILPNMRSYFVTIEWISSNGIQGGCASSGLRLDEARATSLILNASC